MASPGSAWHREPVQQRLASLLDPPILFGHRGAAAYARHNTIESFELGLKLGATGLESDVWVTADGTPVLDHDGVIRRGIRRRFPLHAVRDDELPPWMPTLATFFDAVPAHVEVSLDLKCLEAGPAVLDLLETLPEDRARRTWLCHPSVEYLIELRERHERVRLLNSTRLSRLTGGPERRAAWLKEVAIDGINLHREDWTGGLTTLFHRFDLVAFCWDLQFEHQLRPALRMGVDAVYTDHVDRAIDAYRAEELTP